MKKLIVLVLAVSMVLGLVACGTPAATDTAATAAAETPKAETQNDLDVDMGEVEGAGTVEGTNYNFAIVYGGVHPFFDPWAFGAQQAALDLGIPIPNVTSPQDWDQTQQNAIIDGLVAGGVGGIGMFTADAVAGNEKDIRTCRNGNPGCNNGRISRNSF